MPVKRVCKQASHKTPSPKRIAIVERAVEAAYLALVAEGLYPSVQQVRRRAKYSIDIVENIRARLIIEGRVPYVASGQAFRHEDDPFTEQPDDPDAAEVQARIEAIRAQKLAAGPPPLHPVEIAVVRYHTPNHRPHSRQRVVA
jgi:uncharacterized protein involved in type VI secretion and phage assembly